VQKGILATGFSLLCLFFPLKVSALNYDEIYVFGDSYSDPGNLFNATEEAIPPSPIYFNGRFANGSIWVEYLAQDLGLSFNPRTNYAVGGATTGVDNISVPGQPGLQQQLSNFIVKNPSADPKALYIVWAGFNDYFNYFLGNVPNPSQTVANLSTTVKSLAAVGAKDIMLVNLPDLGKFPVASFNSKVPSLFSELTSKHNSDLETTVKLLDQQLGSDVNIIPLKVNSLFSSIITEPSKFGLTNVTDYCVENLSVVPLKLPNPPVACDPNKFLFWDPVHATTVTHRLIGEFAFSTLFPASIPEPSVLLGLLAFGALGVISPLKHK
jgi:phospholipase/lecithinase/hemolysin